MAVSSIKEIHDGRDGEDEEVRRWTRVWRVNTDSHYDDATVVLAAAPRIGAVHPKDPGARLRRRRARNESFSKRVWIVTAAYSSGIEIEENPLAEPATIEWGTESFQRPFYKDRNGDAILNSAGFYFNPPVMDDDSRLTVSIAKNLAAVPTWVLAYRNATNSDQCVIDGIEVAVGQAKVRAIHISGWQERNDVRYRVLTLTIHLDEDGWDREILDQSLYEKVSGVVRRISVDGRPVSSPWPIDATGEKIAVPTPANVNYVEAKTPKRLPFSVLPLN